MVAKLEQVQHRTKMETNRLQSKSCTFSGFATAQLLVSEYLQLRWAPMQTMGDHGTQPPAATHRMVGENRFYHVHYDEQLSSNVCTMSPKTLCLN